MTPAGATVLGREIDWPPPPTMYSYSSIADIRQCPRRWSLRNAAYPDIWNGYGYPPRPGYGTLRGLVLHRAMELLAQAASGLSGGEDLRAPAIQQCGGYTQLLRTALKDVWASLQRNPRIAPALANWQLRIEQDIGEFRQLLQKLVAQTPLPPSAHTPGTAAHTRGQVVLGNGVYQEIAVASPSLRLKGKIDLLVVSDQGDIIIDFKTGEPDAGHRTQLEFYALMWSEDARNGKGAIPRLKLVYPDHETDWEAPDAEVLEGAVSSVAAAVAECDDLLSVGPPPARPSPENCRYCDVRQLCDDYWATGVWERHQPFLPGEAFDLDVEITEAFSAKSFGFTANMVVPPSTRTGTRLQTTGRVKLSVGDRVRLMGVRIHNDDDLDESAVRAGASAEVFPLRQPGSRPE